MGSVLPFCIAKPWKYEVEKKFCFKLKELFAGAVEVGAQDLLVDLSEECHHLVLVHILQQLATMVLVWKD